jgi:hypothetical protein
MAVQPSTPRSRGNTDAPHSSPVLPDEDIRTILINRVSWGAVFAGVVVALVCQLILNLIGLSVGAASVDPTANSNPSVSAVSLGAGIWWAVSGIIASGIGGFAAGRLSGEPKESSAGWHGLTAWALTTIVIVYLISSAAGSFIGGAANAVGSVASTVGRAAEPAVHSAVNQAASNSSDPFASIEQSLRGNGGNDPADMRDAAVTSVRALVTGDPAQQGEARERAAQAVAKARNVPIEQARTEVAQYEQQYRQAIDQAKQTAKAAADTAKKAVTRGALYASISLILGAIAAWFGGRFGAVDPTLTSSSLFEKQRG